MKKGMLLAVYVVLAAVIIGLGSWYADTLTQTQPQSGDTSAGQGSTQTQNNTMDTLKVVDDVIGTGTVAEAGDTVSVNYTGTLDDGTVFDSSLKPGRTPFNFVLGIGQVIKGWDQGVAGMKVGGKRTLTIPPSLGYGAQGAGTVIPPNATLHFEVTLLSVTKGSAQ